MTGAGISPNCQIANVWLVKKPGRRHSTLPSRPLTGGTIGKLATRTLPDAVPRIPWNCSWAPLSWSAATLQVDRQPEHDVLDAVAIQIGHGKGDVRVAKSSTALNSSIGCSHGRDRCRGEANEPELFQFPG